VEPHLAPARKAMARNLAVTHEHAEVLDVNLQELSGVSGREHAWEVGCRAGVGGGHEWILPLPALPDRHS
jgi:hypothetical protein